MSGIPIHKYKFHTFTALLAVLALSTASLVGVHYFGVAEAQASGGSDPSCPAGNIVYIDNTATTTTVTLTPGVHKVSLAVTSVLAPQVKSVLFTIDNGTNALGRGVQVSSNPYWEMQWLSQVTPSGQHAVGATLTLTNGSCQVPPAPVMVNNGTTAQGNLALGAAPAAFEGVTNEPRNFVLNAGASSTTGGLDITPWAYFKISPVTLGVVTPADGSNNFRFSAGPSAGTSKITVLAQYGGVSRQLDIPVKVLAQTVSGSGTTTTSDSGNSTGSGGTTSSSPSSAPTALESDAPVKQCVVSKIGEARYNLITSGKERPTSAEFEAFSLCFAIRNYVIPSSWAPVEAKKESIQNKPTSDEIKVATAANVTETRDGAKKQTLKFSGKAKPNAKVLMYIFSEPLVVTTSADKNGEWSYSLEDPLTPGKHEAYALVNKGDGSYERSSVFSFAVAKVEAAAANPNGLSLNLEKNQPTAKKDTTSLKLYIVAVVLLMLLVAGLAWNLRRIKSRKNAAAPGTPAAPADTETPLAEPKPASENTQTVEDIGLATEPAPAEPTSAPPLPGPADAGAPAPDKPIDTDASS